jgi:hypothetical protein
MTPDLVAMAGRDLLAAGQIALAADTGRIRG